MLVPSRLSGQLADNAQLLLNLYRPAHWPARQPIYDMHGWNLQRSSQASLSPVWRPAFSPTLQIQILFQFQFLPRSQITSAGKSSLPALPPRPPHTTPSINASIAHSRGIHPFFPPCRRLSKPSLCACREQLPPSLKPPLSDVARKLPCRRRPAQPVSRKPRLCDRIAMPSL